MRIDVELYKNFYAKWGVQIRPTLVVTWRLVGRIDCLMNEEGISFSGLMAGRLPLQ